MSSSAGDSRRKAEIEAKRAKLAELRKAREERTARLQTGRPGSTGATGSNEASTPVSGVTSRKDLDDLVATLVGTSSPSQTPVKGPRQSILSDLAASHARSISSPRQSVGSGPGAAESDFGEGESIAGPSVTTLVSRGDGEVDGFSQGRGAEGLVDVETELFEFPQKERVYYTKEVQTTSSDIESGDMADVGSEARESQNGISPAAEALIRRRILEEQEIEREKERLESIRREEERLEKEIAEELRVISPEEARALFSTSDFSSFVAQSSKIVERALTENYDYLKDYTAASAVVGDSAEGRTMKQARCFYDEKLCKGRSITGLDWSTQHPELLAVSYSRSSLSLDSPDGLVLIWNLHLLDRPEFVFQAQTDVLSVSFSPFHANLVIGGTYSGQVLIWDTRAKALPTLKTPLSAAGHTHPIYNIKVVGTQNAHQLITASTDGVVCSWMMDLLAQPQSTLELLNTNHNKTDEVAITSLDFARQEMSEFWVGSEEGSIFRVHRFDRAGAKAGIQQGEVYRGHSGPVTSLAFHKSSAGNVDFSDLFLSSAMDWTAKLWRVKSNNQNNGTATSTAGRSPTGVKDVRALLSFEESSDYVLDVRWHPIHPSVFSLVDAAGSLQVYNLLYDLERPFATSMLSSEGLNKVAFDKGREGKFVAAGGVDGKTYVMDIEAVLGSLNENEGVELQRVLGRLSAGNL